MNLLLFRVEFAYMNYDQAYSRVEDYFGSEPDSMLIEYHHRLDKTGPILDIGAGQGRNALFLARKGYSVDAIDPSKVAVDMMLDIALNEGLPLNAYSCGFDTFVPSKPVPYAGILIFGLIRELPWESIRLLLKKVDEWTDEGSLVFVTAFTVSDPTFPILEKGAAAVKKNSFMDDEGEIRTFLESGEILSLFDTFKVIHHHEGLGRVHRHGNSPPERHARAEAVFMRQ